MGVASGVNVEILPGYQLLEKLGQGGFGEVWKARAPGGLLKAVKIVYGNLEATGNEGGQARQELRSLERVKSIRHPFLLSLERVDIIDGQLIIVMELADKNLMDRFKECRSQGMPGIPRQELLGLMQEAAEALDLMNIKHQLQHLDIKPQNLFLVYDHIKIADFGLVKDLEGVRGPATSSLTALYAPPETFEGQVSRFSDQYNLAIVYLEMLTGKVPFNGSNPRQLMMQHLTGKPNLDSLPPDDRSVIARALSKKPEDRFPTCRDMVLALQPTSANTAGRTPDPSDRMENPIRGAAPPITNPSLAPAKSSSSELSPSTGSPKPQWSAPTSPAAVETPREPERLEVFGDGVLFPALVIGVGAVGRKILRHLRKTLYKRCGSLDALPHVRFLLLDTDPDELREARRGETETAFSEAETLLARLQRGAHYLKPGSGRQAMERWLSPKLLTRLPRDQTTTLGSRTLGRLAFISNYGEFDARLSAQLQACLDPEALEAGQKKTGLGLRSSFPRVYIVAGLGGGSGGGMFLDLAYTVRYRLRTLGFSDPDVVALLPLPAVDPRNPRRQANANAFAALAELKYFSDPNTVFTLAGHDLAAATMDANPPFKRCMLFPMPKEESPASLQELASLAGETLGRELTTPLGKVADKERAALTEGAAHPRCQTLGSFWFTVPRRLLLQRLARSLCHRLVQDWRGADRQNQNNEERIHQWIAAQLRRYQIQSEPLMARLQSAVADGLGHTVEEEFQAALTRSDSDLLSDLPKDFAAAQQAIKAVEELVGRPDAPDAGPPAPLKSSLDAAVATLQAELHPRMAEVALQVLTEAHFRLLGCEDLVQTRVADVVADMARAHADEAERCFKVAASLHPQLEPLLQPLRKPSFWGGWTKRSRPTEELHKVLFDYGVRRYQGMTHLALSVLCNEMLANFQKYRGKVGCCRSRIKAFLRSFDGSAGGTQPNVDLGMGQYLLPAGCRSLPEAVEHILETLTAKEREEINRRVQALIGRKFAAQIHVCTSPTDFFNQMEEEILQEVAAYAEAPLGRAHAAEMYVEQRPHESTVLAELATAFEEATPELAGARLDRASELCILAVPPGAEGDYFRGLVKRALPDQKFISAESTDDIVFYREMPALDLTALPQLGPAALEAYHHFLQDDLLTPHNRMDILNWNP